MYLYTYVLSHFVLTHALSPLSYWWIFLTQTQIFFYTFKLFWIGIFIPFNGKYLSCQSDPLEVGGLWRLLVQTPRCIGEIWNIPSSYPEYFPGWRRGSMFFVYWWVEMILNYRISIGYFPPYFRIPDFWSCNNVSLLPEHTHCLSIFSVAEIKYADKSNWGDKGLLLAPVPDSSSSLRVSQAPGTWNS